MTDRTWVGGGNDNATDPDNWSPTGVPVPGETLAIPGGSEINIKDNDLRGDPLVLLAQYGAPAVTLNLSRHAQVDLQTTVVGNNPPVTVNVRGVDSLNVAELTVAGGGASITANLADSAKLVGTFSMAYSGLAISGGEHSRWQNNGTTTLYAVSATIDTAVTGSGTINAYTATLPTRMEFAGYVSSGQTVNVRGNSQRPGSAVVIDQPRQFHGTIAIQGAPAEIPSYVDLLGLAKADSWSYANDMLSVYNACGKVIDKLHIVSDDPYQGPAHGLSISKSATGTLHILAGNDFSGTLAAPTS